MKTRAAVLHGVERDWEVVELELDAPREHEVLVRYVAAGLCHSDEHLRHGDIVPRFPMVGGHEGAGIVEEVGPSVTRVKPGDHIVSSFIPSCGRCRWCSTGQQNLCDLGAYLSTGCMPDETFRFHRDGVDYGGMCMLGTFSQWAVISEHSCVPVDEDLPLETAVLVGCGVPTGWGSAVNGGAVRPGDTVVVYGVGGIGINAIQGARHAGAKNVVAVDPIAMKREKAEELGATHSAADDAEAHRLVLERLCTGVGADSALITVGVVDEQVVQSAVDVIRKGGRVVITGLASPEKKTVQVSGHLLTVMQKSIHGLLFGGCNPIYDMRRMLDLYRAGQIKLDELITRRYRLEEINEGYQDMLDGRNIRGVIVHEH